ncbi:arad-like aldolase/epimerase [Aureobasidium pullulans]|nr:arad-like aldolase/epimerase [Aureobasidium pullulans]
MSSTDIAQFWCSVVTANHVLDYFSLVTGYGHFSARNPLTNTTFFHNIVDTPGTITSSSNFIEFNVYNGAPVASNSTSISPYSEMWIHQAIYKRYPSINAVVHSHSRAVLPFANTGVPLVPQLHLDGVLGDQVPVFDIAEYYRPNETHDFLVNLPHLGAALADTFSTPQNNATKKNSVPDYPVVLQRAHGLSAAAESIEQAVFTAWSAQDAANIATKTLNVLSAYQGSAARLTKFTEQELEGSMALGRIGYIKDWPWFVDQVRRRGNYRNDAC